ncbi:MAG: type II toxin-antitoxin system RelE/ParE family toxin [Clostridia bacterium]
MYRIELYEDVHGYSQIGEFLENLEKRSIRVKDARIQYQQVAFQIQLLSQSGCMRLPSNIAKHLSDGIWELRPGNNRVLFFCFENGAYVLLHQFVKKTQKTPEREIDRARSERADYSKRMKEVT